MKPGRGREALLAALLALLPVLAHAPAWWEERLLGPGDGAALHYPLRQAVWEAYRRGELPSWNPSVFGGTPLLAAYRAGAFYPPMALLAPLPPFVAFQALVLGSLAAAAVLTFVYLRRLGAGSIGAYLAGLSFALGPYLVGHLEDTATLVAAPLLPLLLLAAEAFTRRPSPRRGAGMAAALALLLLAGSPAAARAGCALLAGRLLIGRFFPAGSRRLRVGEMVGFVAAGALLAAPQIVPTLLLAAEAGRPVTGLADAPREALPGATGLVLRYVSHTPAPSLALAALPLALTQTPVRVLGVALALCLALQWGRGPLAAPGALALAFDLTLTVLAGLSLSAQWQARREPFGGRLRAYFLFACLAAAGALSVSTAVLARPLPQVLAGAVGILALALILYFSLATSPDPVKAGVWLLPLTVSFVLQPHGRQAWDGAPTRKELEQPTPTREAVDKAMGARGAERILTLTRSWPHAEAYDLAYANLSALAGRRTLNGYEPLVPLRTRMAFDGMGVGGTLPGVFFRGDPLRLEALGVRWVQVPASALTTRPDATGFGDTLDQPLEVGRPRFFPLPIVAATEIHVASWMAHAVAVGQDERVARVVVQLASHRELETFLLAGRHTGEWAFERPDVRGQVRHARPPILESWKRDGFEGHHYRGVLPLPGRYIVAGLSVERLPTPGRLSLSRLSLLDAATGTLSAVSLASGLVSDVARFRETVATPAVRLFEVPAAPGDAWVADTLRLLPDDDAVLKALRSGAGGLRPRHDALAVAAEAAGWRLAGDGRSSRAELERAGPGRIRVQAEGPGLLVVAESWDHGWRAALDGRPVPVLRVNHVQMAVMLPPGFHRVTLRHHVRGLGAGLALAALGALGLTIAWRRRS